MGTRKLIWVPIGTMGTSFAAVGKTPMYTPLSEDQICYQISGIFFILNPTVWKKSAAPASLQCKTGPHPSAAVPDQFCRPDSVCLFAPPSLLPHLTAYHKVDLIRYYEDYQSRGLVSLIGIHLLCVLIHT